ncbi:MAG: tetratricopeptide repeat protein [candidate division Zixibacteria bacterium]|nr:tetratricopeptide repeat protein [candidate division Zixibacteria bacterium]
MMLGHTATTSRRQKPVRGLVALVLGAILLMGSGCVYFNTFYHAKQYYGQGEKMRKQARGQSAIGPGKTHYLDAIEKANKVVEEHPDSKYHDDALFMIGMSYFHIQNFTKSEAAFRELLVTHPESKFIEEARLYLARCRIQLGDERAGFRVFTELAETARKDEWRAEALYQRGQFFFDNESYDSAKTEFMRVIDEYPKSERAQESRLLAAQSFRKLDQADKAIALYQPLLEEEDHPDLQLRAYRGIGEAYYESGRPDSGIAVFESLIDDERFEDSVGVIRLSLARGLENTGDYEAAWRQYERVAAVLERTPYAAEAYFHMAEIKQFQEQDLVAAKDLYDKSRAEHTVGDLANLALTRSANITQLEQFRLELGRGELRSPAQINSLGQNAFVYDPNKVPRFERVLPYSIPEARPPYQPRNVVPEDKQHLVQGPEPPTEEERELMALLMPDTVRVSETPQGPPTHLAPFFGPPVDSAEVRYNLKRRVLLPQHSWEALFGARDAFGPPSPGYLYDFGTNGLFGPQTPPDSILAPPPVIATVDDTAAARRRQELEAERDEKLAQLEQIGAPARTQLQLAELYRFSLNNPDSALVEYKKMVESYPRSHYAAKALLGAADVLRDDLGDTAAAETYLRRILDEYPYTDYAGVSIARLGLEGTAADTAHPAKVYEEAEDAYLIDNNPREAIRQLENFTIRFPESRLVPYAEWAIVALREQYFPAEDSTIYYAYQGIQEELTGTPFGEAASEKLTYTVERPKRKKRYARSLDSLTLAGADTTGMDPDSVTVGSSLPMAPTPQTLPQRIKTTGDFLFPESEIGTFTQEMRVVYKILINFNGEIEDYEALSETDSQAINEAARLAIENTVFNADSIPVDSLNMYYRYDLRIQPPAQERDEFDQFGIDPTDPTKRQN